LVVDSDGSEREFVSRVLQRGGFRTESFAGGEEALAAAYRQSPRLVVLEVRLRDICGYEVCRALRARFGVSISIVFMSRDRTDASDRVAGLLLGADDYLVKPVAPDELLTRVRALVRRLGVGGQQGDAAALAGLTDRELDVLRLLADGFDQPAIARRLVIAPKTVAKHLEHILRKLPARSRAEAVAIAYRRGLYGSSWPTTGA
jgi:two-component system OmpR family response regulator